MYCLTLHHNTNLKGNCNATATFCFSYYSAKVYVCNHNCVYPKNNWAANKKKKWC